jgi:hypothetical protein
MNELKSRLFSGGTVLHQAVSEVKGEFVSLLGEPFYKISHSDAMEPFFVSVVSSSDHWLFIASTGGLSAGRVSAERALFPYYTVDKLTENSEHTGGKTILLVRRADGVCLWEPFSERWRGAYRTQRNLYKNVPGTALVFEEINHDLGLTFRYAWRTSEAYGFVKTAWLINHGPTACGVELLDGLQNLLPANIASTTQHTYSVLLDAYKRGELEAETGLGLFSLSSCLTDLAEPSESLLATVAVQIGLEATGYLLSSGQLDHFRSGLGITPETDVRGRRGAYFVHASLELAPDEQRSWHVVAEVHQDSAAVAQWIERLRGDRAALYQDVEHAIAANTTELLKLLHSADGAQLTQAPLSTAHHTANVLFNIARGGVFADNYSIDAADLREFIAAHHPALLNQYPAFFTGLPARLPLANLRQRAAATGSANLKRLCNTYLPLTFSRRHGDPSRPWNVFTLNIQKADGSPYLGYQGNWRDIFQNWEALAYSYPEFVEAMIGAFLNATTADGYNPYRLTREGVDWEQPEPHNPWSNIGYWSDHQIIYLQKLLEISARVHPGRLEELLTQRAFSYANVPYRIKPYASLLQDPRNTIDFDWTLQAAIEARVREGGLDGKLVSTPNGQVFHASLTEKLLVLLLAKLVNFVPEGGLWMNTQRPEWNDANNALVGNGLSVVTVAYLRRYVAFFRELISRSHTEAPVSEAVHDLYRGIAEVLLRFRPMLADSFSDEQRRAMMDALGEVGGEYRRDLYTQGLSGKCVQLPLAALGEFLGLVQRYFEHSLRANKRSDDLYHAYNILQLSHGRAGIGRLYEMLEGQVAILSSGLLSGAESLALLKSLRHSALYRADQHSYILYPDRELPGFLVKNRIAAERVQDLALVSALVDAQEKSLIVKDINGDYHFNGCLRNAKDLAWRLERLQRQPQYAELVAREAGKLLAVFEDTFHHAEFTGRSGTFFAYEGLGSIYWHMVSKLLLAVQETAWRARREPCAAALQEAYRDIRAGLGYHKPPEIFGAFPIDPYSHTPKGQGAKQPGMTGLVKEEILTRQVELGWIVQHGQLAFDPFLLDPHELLTEPSIFSWFDLDGQRQSLNLEARSLAYTVCQVPVVVQASNETGITVHLADGSTEHIAGLTLDAANSRHIFERDGSVHHLVVSFSRG